MASLSLYASLGFEVKTAVALMQARPAVEADESVRPITEADLPAPHLIGGATVHSCIRDQPNTSPRGMGDEVQLLALAGIVRRVRHHDRIRPAIFPFQVHRIFRDIAASQRDRLRIERKPLDHVQLVAVAHRRIQEAR